jgi:site-specific recombinase XerD
MAVSRLRVVGAPREGTLPEAAASFLKRGQAKNLSPHTLGFYRSRLEAFTRYLDGRGLCPSPTELTPDLLRDFLTAEVERTSPATAAHAHMVLTAFCKYLVGEEVLTASPMDKVDKPRRPKRLMPTLSAEEVEKLLAGASGRTFNGARLRAVVLTLLDCGLRVSELCGLDLGDVDWDDQTLRVMGKGSKEREVPFGQAARLALHSYLTKRGDLPGQEALFVTCYGTRLDRMSAQRLLRRAGEKVGLPGVHPHQLRHTSALMFLRNGGDPFSLQKLLGHSDLTMTRRYAELAQADVVAKHRQASPGDRFLSAAAKGGGRKRLR